jgi:hypothetical protein
VTRVQLRLPGSNATRMNGAVVTLRDAAGATVHEFAAITGAANNATLNLDPPAAVTARSVHIAGAISEQVLLAELDVMGAAQALPPPVTVTRPQCANLDLRAGKHFGGNATSFLGPDTEFLVNEKQKCRTKCRMSIKPYL